MDLFIHIGVPKPVDVYGVDDLADHAVKALFYYNKVFSFNDCEQIVEAH
jgi:hypothetical protein